MTTPSEPFPASPMGDSERGSLTDGYPEFVADTVESLREWVMDNEFVPDAEFRCSKRQAMALLDSCDGLFRERVGE